MIIIPEIFDFMIALNLYFVSNVFVWERKKGNIDDYAENNVDLRHFEIKKYRSSHQRCSMKKGVLRNFTKFTRKNMCQSLFFNKVAGLAKVFSCEFCEISKNTF